MGTGSTVTGSDGYVVAGAVRRAVDTVGGAVGAQHRRVLVGTTRRTAGSVLVVCIVASGTTEACIVGTVVAHVAPAVGNTRRFTYGCGAVEVGGHRARCACCRTPRSHSRIHRRTAIVPVIRHRSRCSMGTPGGLQGGTGIATRWRSQGMLAGWPGSARCWCHRVGVVSGVARAGCFTARACDALAVERACVLLASLAVEIRLTEVALGGEAAVGVIAVEASTEEVADRVCRGRRVCWARELLVVETVRPSGARDAYLALAVPSGPAEAGQALALEVARRVGAVGVWITVVQTAAALVHVEAAGVGCIGHKPIIARAVVTPCGVDTGGVRRARVHAHARRIQSVAVDAGAREATHRVAAGRVLWARGDDGCTLIDIGTDPCSVVGIAAATLADERAFCVKAVLALPADRAPSGVAKAPVRPHRVDTVGIDRARACQRRALVHVLALVRARDPLVSGVALAGGYVGACQHGGAAVGRARRTQTVRLCGLVAAYGTCRAHAAGAVVPGVAQALVDAAACCGGQGVAGAGRAIQRSRCASECAVRVVGTGLT
eukprot:762433-Hanusia_phi.AAC.18